MSKTVFPANPEDCMTWCLVEIPAAYTTVTKKVAKGCAASYTALKVTILSKK